MSIRKSVFIFVLFTSFLSAVSLLNAASFPVKVTQHWVTTHDGYQLDVDVYAPKYGKNLPVIIFSPSWGLPKIQYLFPCMRMAGDGYIAVSYSARGWFTSTGKINVGEENDLRDVSTIIDFVLDNYPADIRNIGMSGISMGACRSLQAGIFDSRIKAVAALSGTARMRDALYHQNTPNKSWGGTETGGDTNMISDMVIELENRRNVPEILKWLDDISAFRLIDDYAATGSRLSVYISNYYDDPLFAPNNIMEFFELIDIPDKVIDLNDGMHAFPVGFGCLNIPEPTWETLYRWFDYYLKGIDDGISDRLHKTPVSFQLKNEKTRLYFDSWPSQKISYRKYYLSYNSLKSILTGKGGIETVPSCSFFIRNIKSGTGSSASLGPNDTVSQILNVDTGLNIFTINKDFAMLHISEPAANEIIFAGIPILDMTLSASQKDAQIIAYLYDVNPLGYGELITHSARTLWDGIPDKRRKLSFEFHATAFRLKKGHRLAVVIDLYDKRCGFPESPEYTVSLYYNSPPELKMPFVN